MSQRLGCKTCDSCQVVLDSQEAYIIRKTKLGKEMHFCSKRCLNKKPHPHDYEMYITDDEAATFIQESNAIEGIHFDKETVLDVWRNKRKDIPEIYGHVRALRYLIKKVEWADLDVQMLEKIHRYLMKELLPKSNQGIRKALVRVGSRLCPYPIEIRPMLGVWLNKVKSLKNPTEEDIWQTHLAFEYIHPFIDGNGRIGRLLWLFLRYKFGFSFKYVSSATKHEEYYPFFDTFNWDKWVESC